MICYLWAETGPRIDFDDRVVAHFARHRQRHLLQREAGGQLFARLDGDAATIEVATQSSRPPTMTATPSASSTNTIRSRERSSGQRLQALPGSIQRERAGGVFATD